MLGGVSFYLFYFFGNIKNCFLDFLILIILCLIRDRRSLVIFRKCWELYPLNRTASSVIISNIVKNSKYIICGTSVWLTGGYNECYSPCIYYLYSGTIASRRTFCKFRQYGSWKHYSVWTSIGSEIFEKQFRLCILICAQTRNYNNHAIGVCTVY